ncbi:MAG: nitrous oxide reductase accessory protein NosL [Hydrogenophaga sp.]|uniref:nitrous oxide reductase accessory protein NosL n=1 Tax=Hydrogenophaga sp. TaxID=1904254 RepID=UPI0025C66CB9|nr:nitrous oxide reductase accessory protein NosL [Hydrogenophaga sp.]MBT9551145.1 nitrous oxide reductase accessory protein NosL [Hydrogenophaga sp.]
MPSRRTAIGLSLLGGTTVFAGLGWRAVRGATAPVRANAARPGDVCLTAPTFSHDPASGLPLQAAREVPPEARCPVCGMFPARQPRWAAQVIFRNGDVQYLDSPLSLFLYLQRVPRYTAGQSADRIVASHVTDLDTGAWVPAERAWYVHGSRLMGPMRTGNLPAFATVERARAFATREGGEWFAAARLRQGLPASLQRLAPHTHG